MWSSTQSAIMFDLCIDLKKKTYNYRSNGYHFIVKSADIII